MSEYQYYEFCQLNKPLPPSLRKEMASFSSRTNLTTHGAYYVYNYGDFRGDPKKLLLKHFDVFFYIANWGTVRLMFKYSNQEVNLEEIKKYNIRDVISCKQHGQYVLLDIELHNEEGCGWIEGEGLLVDLLGLYDEIKMQNYQFLKIVTAIHTEFQGESQVALDSVLANMQPLSSSQEAFLALPCISESV